MSWAAAIRPKGRWCQELISKPRHGPVQVVFVGALDLGGDDVADAQRAAAGDVDVAVDLRRIRLGAALRNAGADFVDDHLLAGADLALQPSRGDLLLPRHQRIP